MEAASTKLFGDTNKRMSIERVYQKKTQLEHILLRPDTYIGSVEEVTQPMYVYDKEKDAIVVKTIKYVPGLYKIFDEILVNAADNKQRDSAMKAIKVVIDPEANVISVWNDGKGIPVEMHKKEQMYVPSMIFGHLLTSSNYDDKQKKVTGGRNGYGAKLCNIFSEKFTIETSSSDSNKSFKQSWTGNMSKAGKEVLTNSKGDYTKVTFVPDLAKFGMIQLDEDIVALMTRRVYDLAGCVTGVRVYLNGQRIPISNFQSYVRLYTKVRSGDEMEAMEDYKIIHEKVSSRWEVCVTVSNNGFQQASFVNSIATTKGGKHVDHVVEQLVAKIASEVKKKNKGGMELKPHQIKSHMWIFINCLIENPAFDSQTKENMTLKVSSFGSKCELSDKFLKDVVKCGIVENCVAWAQAKSKVQLNKMKKGGPKNVKLRGIAKLDDANDAGGRNALDCTLIITEGDSAKALAVSGLSVIGRDKYGVFPLRGKLLNVRDASHHQLMKNEEILNLVKILGLEYGKVYTENCLSKLRYGHLMIMCDQDQDGSHIKGLVINFIHHNWPGLIKTGFMQEFITPIVKVTKGQEEIPFFSLPEFEQWKAVTDNHHTWKVKYYKGLGTSTAKEAKEYFSDMDRHCIQFVYGGPEDDHAITLAFSKTEADGRKEWLTRWLDRKKEKKLQGMDESFLYGERVNHVTFSEFVNKELILFSNADNERSIGSLVDGLKPGQRKVIFTCLKRNDKRDVKVAQLAGSVGEKSAYHHGEASLMSTIINLAQNYVGSNNVNLLLPIGQFGTRLAGGKDAASARYIFTLLSPVARKLFIADDDPSLNFLYEDNLKIEPEWYCPVIPLVLVNGCEGIGTGYSTFVPNHDPREIVANLKRMMLGEQPQPMMPKYKGFKGVVAHVSPDRYAMWGNIAKLSATELEITELPIKVWTQSYKESVLEPMLHGNEKIQPFITDYKEYHTETTVKFVVTLTESNMEEAEKIGFHKKFKLEASIATSNMVLFDSNGCIKKYSTALDILEEFYYLRLDRYVMRKEYLEGKLQAEADRISAQARFVSEMYSGIIVFTKKTKQQMIGILKERKYPSDPVKVWKKRITDGEEEESEEVDKEASEDEKSDYNYLLGMPMWNMSQEKKNELLKDRDKKVQELESLKLKTPKDLWSIDLDAFLEALDEVEEKEREALIQGAKITAKPKKGKGRQAKLTTSASSARAVTEPSPFAEEIKPVVPEFSEVKKTKAVPKSRGKAKEGADSKQSKLKFTKKEKQEVEDMLAAIDDQSDSERELKIDEGAEDNNGADKKVVTKRAPKSTTAKPAKKLKVLKREAIVDLESDKEEELPLKERLARTASKPVKYCDGSSSDEDGDSVQSGDFVMLNSNESDASDDFNNSPMVAKKSFKKNAVQKPPRKKTTNTKTNVKKEKDLTTTKSTSTESVKSVTSTHQIEEDDDDDMFARKTVKRKPSTLAPKSKGKKLKTQSSPVKKAKAPPKEKPIRKMKKAKYFDDSTDESSANESAFSLGSDDDNDYMI